MFSAQNKTKIFFLCLLFIIGIQESKALTYTVTNNNDAGTGSLRQAILDANANAGLDEIRFDLSVQVINLAGTDLEITDDVNIIGNNVKVTIDGSATSRVFEIDRHLTTPINVRFENLNINNGNLGGNGSGIYIRNANVTIVNCNLLGGRANQGGAIYLEEGSLDISNALFRGNDCFGQGGAIYSQGNTTLTNCSFQSNLVNGVSPFSYGGAIYLTQNGTTTITNCTFFDNYTPIDGGAIYSDNNHTLKVINCTFTENRADSNNDGTGTGAAIYSNSSVAPVLKNNIIYANTSNGANDDLEILNTMLSGDANLVGICDGNCGTGVIDYDSDPNFSVAQIGENFVCFVPQIPSDVLNNGIVDGDTPNSDIFGNTWLSIDLGNVETSTNALYVKFDATGANNGTSWTNAYTNLQTALENAGAGTKIYVAKGTYKPNVEVDVDAGGGNDSREVTFQIPLGAEVYGGFAGNESNINQSVLDARDFTVNETILSGDLNGDDMVTGTFPNLMYNNYAENAYHVVYTKGAGTLTVFDGFTITGGNANGNGENRYGAGWYNIAKGLRGTSSLNIRNTNFYRNKGNSDEVYGVGMYNYSSSDIANINLTLNKVVFSQNIGESSGSGRVAGVGLSNNKIFSGGSGGSKSAQLNFTEVTFSQNIAKAERFIYGVALLNDIADGGNASATLNKVTFAENIGILNNTVFANLLGIGIYNNAGSFATANLTLTECTFSKNKGTGLQEAAVRGAGIRNVAENNGSQANITINRCSFIENTIEGTYLSGAGIENTASGSSSAASNINALLTINNSVFWKNKADGKSFNNTFPRGVLTSHTRNNKADASLMITNSTFVQNESVADNPSGSDFPAFMDLQAQNADETANLTIRNSIIWDNKFNGIIANIVVNPNAGTPGATNVTFENTMIESTGFTVVNGTGLTAPTNTSGNIIDTDPLFTNSSTGDLTLQETSPAVDKGNNAYAVGSFDLAGNQRILATTIDMGAYERDQTAPNTTSFTRKNPLEESTSADELTFLVTFNEDVKDVDVADFEATGTTASITVKQLTASTYDVLLSGGDLAGLNGTVGLNFSSSMNITDLASNALPNTEPTTDETYLLINLKAEQTITFNPLEEKFVGNLPFDLTATASSGLEVTYISANTSVATISGKTVTILSAGTTEITASQAGNENFNPAPNVSQTLVVNSVNVARIPNLFTPNGDGSNDNFIIDAADLLSIDFKIFDRYGRVVYETTDLNEITQTGWDGKNAQGGVYIYQYTGTLKNGQELSKTTGEIRLLK